MKAMLSLILVASGFSAHAGVFECVSGMNTGPHSISGPLVKGSDGNLIVAGTAGIRTTIFYKIAPDGKVSGFINPQASGLRVIDSSGLLDGGDGFLYGSGFLLPTDNKLPSFEGIYRLNESGDFSVVHRFEENTGGGAISLSRGTDGSLYCTVRKKLPDKGSIYRLKPGDSMEKVADFRESDDSTFSAVTQTTGGILVGVTRSGIFRVDAGGALVTLLNFSTSATGTGGAGPLLEASDGFLYGTCREGGAANAGTLFRINLAGEFEKLSDFLPGTTGSGPFSNLIEGDDGSIFGTTSSGVFRYSASGGLERLLDATGQTTYWIGLCKGHDGAFYGAMGGGMDSVGDARINFGEIYRLDPNGERSTRAIIGTGTDGCLPGAAMTSGTDGYLYGTTNNGGAHLCGSFFRMSLKGKMEKLADFETAATGSFSFTPLFEASDGKFYGVTIEGGGLGFGTIFRASASGGIEKLWDLDRPTLSFPFDKFDFNHSTFHGKMVEGPDGALYGTLRFGALGTIYRLTKEGGFSTLHEFPDAWPVGGLIWRNDGHFYGVDNKARLFRITPSGDFNWLENNHLPSGFIQQTSPLLAVSDGTILGAAGSLLFSLNPAGEIESKTLWSSVGSSVTRLDVMVEGMDGRVHGFTSTPRMFRFNPVTGEESFFVPPITPSSKESYKWSGFAVGRDGNLYFTTAFAADYFSRVERYRLGALVESSSARHVVSTRAIPTARVSPGAQPTAVSFQFGTNPDPGTFVETFVSEVPGVEGFTDGAILSFGGNRHETEVEFPMSGLSPNTTYYYRAVVRNPENPVTQFGDVLSFTTPDVPGISVSTASGELADGQASGLAFESTALGYSSRMWFTIRNQGVGPLLIESLTLPDGFSLAGPFTPVIVPPGGEFLLPVDFTDPAPGSVSGTLRIHTNDPVHGSFDIPVNAARAEVDGQPVSGFSVGGNREPSLKFGAREGDRFLIEYSDDLFTWKRIPGLRSGTDPAVEWIDRGPPDTEIHPVEKTRRFYRVWKLRPGS